MCCLPTSSPGHRAALYPRSPYKDQGLPYLDTSVAHNVLRLVLIHEYSYGLGYKQVGTDEICPYSDWK